MRPLASRSVSVVRAALLACGLALSCSDPAPECKALSTQCPSTPPSYANDIVPILNARCSSCHTEADPSGPWPFDTHTDVSDWSTLISRDLERCSMPPPNSGLLFPDSERELVHAWLLCGAPDN